MIKNFVKIAVRNLRKNKAFSFINIFGLAVGLTSFMLIASFVYNELNYDQYPASAKNIYRVKLSTIGNGDLAVYPNVDFGVGPGIQKAFPEAISFTRLSQSGPAFIQYDEKQFKEEHLAYADSNFLRLFSIPLLEGDLSNALTDPNCIVVSKSFAHKYFGEVEALGKSLLVGKNMFKITGVFDKIPENSHFHFDAFLSLSTFHVPGLTWSNIGYFTYLQLNDHVDPKKLEAKFPQLVAKYVVPEIQHDMGVSLAEAQKSVGTFLFSLEPLRDIHLHSNTKYELEPNGDIHYVYIFRGFGCIYFITGLHKFHQPLYRQCGEKIEGSGHSQSDGLVKKTIGLSISDRVRSAHIPCYDLCLRFSFFVITIFQSYIG